MSTNSEAVKECWICHRNEEQVRSIYEVKTGRKHPFWVKVDANWGHEICPICEDIMMAVLVKGHQVLKAEDESEEGFRLEIDNGVLDVKRVRG